MTYKVTWVDRNYKEQSKTFADDPNGPAENGLVKARKFKKTLEEKDKKSPHGLYRSINIKMIRSKLESFIRKIVKEERQRIKESSSQAELHDLATDLIDYLGGQLPTQGYTRNQRIMDYFRELGYKDNDPMIHKIYNLALKLNR